MSEVITVSQSKARCWRTCKQQYNFKHVQKLRRIRVKRPLQFGRIMHDLIEVELEGGDPWVKLDEISQQQGKLFEEEIDEYGNIVDDIALIFEEYLAYWPKNEWKIIPVEGRMSEHPFEIEIMPGVIFNGRLDFLANSKKMNWLGENKTFGQMPNDDHRWKDLQSAVYFRAVDMMGWLGKRHLDGVCWNYISSKAPGIPEIKKNGEMSIRKIRTFPQVVKDIARENKIPLKDVSEQVAYAEECRGDWFQRVYTPINDTVVEFTWNGFVDTARDIAENHDKLSGMNIGRHCDWCDYEPICRARMLGTDVDFVIEREFEVKEDDNAEEKTRKATRKSRPKKPPVKKTVVKAKRTAQRRK